jgi:hypothetical protein
MKKTFIFYVLFTLCILIDASENRSGIIFALRNNADSALAISKKVAELSCNSYRKKLCVVASAVLAVAQDAFFVLKVVR